MNYAITTTLSKPTLTFVSDWAKKSNMNKNEVIEEAIQLYKKVCLKAQIKQGLKERYDEYKNISKDFVSLQFNSIKKK